MIKAVQHNRSVNINLQLIKYVLNSVQISRILNSKYKI